MGGHFSRVGSVSLAQNAYRQAIDDRVMKIMSDYDAGKWSPFVIAVDTIPLHILFGTMFTLHYFRPNFARYVRYASFTLIALFSAWIVSHVRFLAGAYGYGLGLICGVGVMNSAALLLFNDPATAFKRLEQKEGEPPPSNENDSQGESSAIDHASSNGFSHGRKGTGGQVEVLKNTTPKLDSLPSEEQSVKYYWQPYPSTFIHRLDWSFDLVTSFRGPGWNWRIRSLSPLSPNPSSEFPPPPSQQDIQTFIYRTLRFFFILWLWLDVLKVVMMRDPYFLGTAPLSSPPPQYLSQLFPIFVNQPILTRIYRLMISCMGVIICLNYLFVLCPLFYGILLPYLFRYPHYTPLTHPALYPPQQNSFLSVLDNGLAGWWGEWWHQMFRFGVSEPSRALIAKLNWSPKSQKSRILQIMIAFTITGILHAMGSYTMYDVSNPISGSFLFFIFQGVGILSQTYVTEQLKPFTTRLPIWIRRMGNLLFCAIWMYYTGPFFADDAAGSHLWYIEPIPISPLRGLGFGLKGEGWWCWHGRWIIWWDGGPHNLWWRKGWAIV